MDTQFRIWMDQLNKAAGNRLAVPEWPRLLQLMLHHQLELEMTEDRPYVGRRILIDRTSHKWEKATVAEKRAVYGLYHRCLQHSQSVLTIDNEHYLLLSYEVPNQGNHRGWRADLLGINKNGGLVVFEAKVEGNGYGPVAATLEGLDYLSTLSGATNFKQIKDEFPKLIASIKNAGNTISETFHNINPQKNARREVIVLAPPEYFKKYDKTARGKGWQDLSLLKPSESLVGIRFAKCKLVEGVFSKTAEWCH